MSIARQTSTDDHLRSTGAAGIPLTIKLKIAAAPGAAAVPPTAAVLVWHDGRDGNDGHRPQGGQVIDVDGIVEFETVFPGCTAGRWPRIHVEVYSNASAAWATEASHLLATEQVALPVAACKSVYATSRYRSSRGNLATTPLERGYRDRLANVTGSVFDGFVARRTVLVG